MTGKTELPRSASSFWLNLGCFLAIACLFWLPISPFAELETTRRAFLYVVTTALTMALAERLMLRKPAAATSAGRVERSLERAWFRYAGMVVTLLALAFLYWVLPEYRDQKYMPGFQILVVVAIFCLIAGGFYFYFMDSEDEDAYLMIGRKLLRQSPIWDRQMLAEHARRWLVKGFYMPLMLIYTIGNASGLIGSDATLADFRTLSNPDSLWRWYRFIHAAAFFADISIAAAGYLFTLRLFRSEIKSVEPTVLGWFVALLCYSPFWGFASGKYFGYHTPEGFDKLTSGWVCLALAVLILSCELLYAAGTVALGIRFSNLTYRGLVSSGPYSFTKHPAYVFKNLSFWLIYLPFVPFFGWTKAIQGCTLLLLNNGVYYLRARTEERHLSKYPEYVEYALAMNERSIFRRLAVWLPFLKYRAPASSLPAPDLGPSAAPEVIAAAPEPSRDPSTDT